MTDLATTTITILSSKTGQRIEVTVEDHSIYHGASRGMGPVAEAVRKALWAIGVRARKVELLQGYATVQFGYLDSEQWACRIDTHANRGGPLDANTYLDRQNGAGWSKRFDPVTV